MPMNTLCALTIALLCGIICTTKRSSKECCDEYKKDQTRIFYVWNLLVCAPVRGRVHIH